MPVIQIILILFFLFAIYRVIARYREKDLSLRGTAMWVVFWLLASVIVAAPNSTSYFAKIFGIGRGADLAVYLALVALFFIIFRLMVKIEQMNRNLTRIVRKVALDEAEKKNKL